MRGNTDGGRIAVFEFDRDDLEELQYAFGPTDLFRRDVIEAMRWIDEAENEPEGPGIEIVLSELRHG